MPRLMSVSLTEPQVIARSKTVTRRVGWLMLRPGDRLTLCRKVMGRRKGEPLVRVTDVEVLTVRRERLDLITQADVVAEGFPEMTPAAFVEFFIGSHKGCTPESEVTRIEWRYLDAEPHDILPRHRAPDHQNPDGSTTVTMQRCCNGCSDPLGDVTVAEIQAAIDGKPLPDVRAECPRCRAGKEPPLQVVTP